MILSQRRRAAVHPTAARLLLSFFSKKVLTSRGEACNIIQVAARDTGADRWEALTGKHLKAKSFEFRQKRNFKNLLTNWTGCDKIIDVLRNGKQTILKRQSCSLKTKQCNMNHLWFKPDVFKTSIDYEYKQSAISLLSFDLSRFRPKRLFEPIKAFLNFMESLILAQDERWRRA